MGEHIKSSWDKFVGYMKDVGVIGSGLTAIFLALIYVGGKVTQANNTIDEYKDTVKTVQDLVISLKDLQANLKMQEDYKKTVDELKIYTISEVDFLINDTKWRISNNLTLGYTYIQRLEYYNENLSFLTLEQRKDIEYIKKVYYKKITP